MQDRPNAGELLAAVRAFLDEDIVPALEGRRRFHALVAANVLGIVERELAGDEPRLLAEWSSLAGLLGVRGEPPVRTEALRANVHAMTAGLVDRIRAGDADDGAFGAATRAHVRATVVEKLRVANPRFGGAR
jgi:Domain of unknown function (DUF6285)